MYCVSVVFAIDSVFKIKCYISWAVNLTITRDWMTCVSPWCDLRGSLGITVKSRSIVIHQSIKHSDKHRLPAFLVSVVIDVFGYGVGPLPAEFTDISD